MRETLNQYPHTPWWDQHRDSSHLIANNVIYFYTVNVAFTYSFCSTRPGDQDGWQGV